MWVSMEGYELAKLITSLTGLTGADEGDGLQSALLHFSSKYILVALHFMWLFSTAWCHRQTHWYCKADF